MTRCLLAALVVVAGVAPAAAVVTPVPSSVAIFPTETSTPVTLNITFPATTFAGTGAVNVGLAGGPLPTWLSTVPAVITFPFALGATSATVSFQFQASGAAVVGTYSVIAAVTSPAGAGQGTIGVQIKQPSFTGTPSPNPATLTWGAAAQSITVSTTPDPGLPAMSISYSFTGFPTGVTTGGTQVTMPPYPPVTFPFTVAAGTAPGTYSGTLQAISSFGGKTFPMTVIVQQPDIFATFTQPTMALCNGGAAVANGITLQPALGYAGTPTLQFQPAPAGITVTPLAPVASPMPPGQTVPFTVAANGAAIGMHTVTLQVRDTTANINKLVSFTVSVTSPNFIAGVSPGVVTVQAGGASGSVGASVTPNACFAAASVTVTPSGAPAGVTLSPPTATLMGPGFAPATFVVQATAAVPPGTYPLTFTFQPSTGAAKTAAASLVVTAPPDFSLAVSPPLLSVAAGGTGNVTVTAMALNGFTGTVVVAAPTIAGVTFVPADFTVVAGGSRTVAVQVAAGTPTGSTTAAFSGTAVGIVGPRTAPLTLQVTAAPDFAVGVSPSFLSVAAGNAGNVAVTVTPINGFTGMVTLTAPATPGVTFVPAVFTLTPGGAQTVAVQVAAGTLPETTTVVFTGTAVGVAGPRTASFTLQVTAGPDFTLAVSPPLLAVAAGVAGNVVVTATGIGGFSGTVNVTAPAIAGVTFVPATFTLAAGGSQTVSVQVAAGAPAGIATVSFSGTALGVGGPRTASFTLQIKSAPDFSLGVSPSMSSIAAGGTGKLTVTAAGINGFAGTVSVTAPPLPGFTFTPATFSLNAGGAQVVNVQVAAGTPAGSATAAFTGTAVGISGPRTAPFTVQVTPAPDFSIAVNPALLSVVAGRTGTVSLTVTGVNGFAGTVSVTAPAVSGVTFVPGTFTLLAGGAQTVSVQVAASAVPGSTAVAFSATATGIVGPRTTSLTLVIAPVPPAIELVNPPALAAGTPENTLRVSGRNFRPGAMAVVSAIRGGGGAGITVTRTTVLSATLAEVGITVRGDAQPGRYALDILNADGTRTANPAVLLVYAPSGLGAPLGVTTAAIVFPRPYTAVMQGVPLFPRAILATTGTGAIVGVWRYDGVPFDRFVATATGGMPIEVKSNLPIPDSWVGEHRLDLAVEQPQALTTEVVSIIQSVESRSGLEVYAPRNGISFGTEAPLFRWSIVPGATGYEVEVVPVDEGRRPRTFRLSESQWRPSAQDVEELGPGRYRYRVRAVFPGEVSGEPTPWRMFVVIPDRVSLNLLPPGTEPTSGRTRVRWEGGAWGLLYRLEFLVPGRETPLATALTVRSEYVVPDLAAGVERLAVRVVAVGPDGGVRGASLPVKVPARVAAISPGRQFVLASAEPRVVARSPEDGSTTVSSRPRVAARWEGAVNPAEIALRIDETDVTGVSIVTAGAIVYPGVQTLGPGRHTARLALGPEVTEWTFETQERPEAQTPPAPVAPGSPEPPLVVEQAAAPESALHDWQFSVLGSGGDTSDSTTDVHGDAARLQFTGQGDIGSGAIQVKGTGDAGGRHDLEDPYRTVSESRNWQLQLGAKQETMREEVRGGYSPPDFLDQSEFLAAGLARGGVQAKLGSPVGALSFYQTFTSQPAGMAGGVPGATQDIKGVGFEAPWDSTRFLLRAMALRTDVAADPGFAGARGEAIGLLGRFVVGPGLTLFFEGAHGTYTPVGDEELGRRKGYGLRLGANGMVGTFNYTLAVRKTDAGLINPASLGLTPGGVPDRVGGDLMMSKTFGRVMVSGQLRRMESGSMTGGEGPKMVENGGMLNLNAPLGARATLAIAGTLNRTTGDADPVNFMPETSRSQRGINVTFTEMPGRISLSQALGYQEMRDDIQPMANQKMSTANLTASGAVTQALMVSAMLSGTRMDAPEPMGVTDQFMASVQPAITWAATHLTITPRAAYMRSQNDTSNMTSETEQYQMMLQWAPLWFNSLLNFQVVADWNRSKTNLQEIAPGFQRRIVGTLTLRLSGQRASAPYVPPPMTPVTGGYDRSRPMVLGSRI